MVLLVYLIAAMLLPPQAWAEDLFQGVGRFHISRDSSFRGGTYIVPNEDEFYLFESSLRERRGAIVSVGTFRSLEAASRGNFEHLVMADMDPGTVAFNRMQIEALREASSPKDFLARLLGDPRFHQEMPDLNSGNLLEKWAEFERSARAREPDPPRGFWGSLRDSFRSRPQPSEREIKFRYVTKLLELSQAGNGPSGTFLNDPARFAKLKAMAEQGRMHSVAADLGGKNMRKIGSRLAQAGIPVGVLDVSNAPDYFFDRPRIRAGFLQSLEALPFSPDARVNFTVANGLAPVLTGPLRNLWWSYASVPANAYIAAMRAQGARGSYGDFIARREILGGVIRQDNLTPKRASRCIDVFAVWSSAD